VDRHEEIGIVKMALWERGNEVDIGSFLNPHDKESFASALGQALSKAGGAILTDGTRLSGQIAPPDQ